VKSGNFFAELKRRNVVRMAGLYLVGAWLLTQVASTVLPTFDVPSWALRGLIITLALGFVPALIFSWVFELTPQGLKRDEEVAPEQSIGPQTGRRMDRMIIVVLLLALGYFVFDKFVLTPRRITTDTASLPNDANINSKSIAVLPFDNLSRDPDNAYFAEGVQDEILTRLAKVADLKVIARTSTQKFKSSPENLSEIAKQLGVLNILEGSVQKANDQVRVNVQLINATTDAHLWAEIYDRKLTDIFAVESDIAKTIADALQAKLSGAEKTAIAKKPTENPEAYELYLKGRFFWNKRSGADLHKAIEFFNQAIAKDPNFALAYAGLADSYLLLPNYGGTATADALPPARAAVTKALELDASLAEAYASLALLETLELRLERSVADLERAVQLKPNYATAHHWLALAHMSLAHFDQSITQGKRAAELDPLSVIINADLVWIYVAAGRLDEAEAQARKTLEIDPRFFLVHYYLGGIRQKKGQLTDAIAEYQQAFDLNGDFYSLAGVGQAYARAGKKAEAQTVLARMTEAAKTRHVTPYAWAVLYLGLGDKNRALDELEKAYQGGDTNYLFLLKVDPLFDDLRGDPRFEALVQKVVSPKP
jgi:TolB-like protein/Flp pilus assembly protein TadD